MLELFEKLPFELTTDQKNAVWEIYEDMNKSSRMNRLLQGDVGSGKTIVAIIAMYLNYLSGYQSALMAPTELLATQHYNNIVELFSGMNLSIELLKGSQTKKEKQNICKRLANGEIDMVIGTHTLILLYLDYNGIKDNIPFLLLSFLPE